MEILTASELRLPSKARRALARFEHVEVAVQRSQWVLMSVEDYELANHLREAATRKANLCQRTTGRR